MGRAIGLGAAAAVGGALALAVVVWVLVRVPAISSTIGIYIAAAGIVGIGYAVGEAVRYGSGQKLDRRLRYVAAGGVFLGWLATAILLPSFNVSAGFLGNPVAIVGLVIAFYVASSRVRV